ncbi:MAG: sigma-70 family RNA polymerase sigma factor, partial [Roseburia sp.]
NELLMYFRAKKKASREVSLYEPIGIDKEGNQIHLLDIMESEEPDVIERLSLDAQTKKLIKLVPQLLRGRELEIIIKRYGLFGQLPMTQREIASKLGISRSYVSRIEKKALEKLKKGIV